MAVEAALIYPQRSRVAASNLGYHTVASMMRDHGSYRLGQVTFPPPEAERDRRWPRLRGLDLVAVSVSFEEDYPLLVRLLAGVGIPPRASRRGPGHPLVLVGGIGPTINPEPLAPLADLIFLGEAEAGLPDLLDLIAAEKTSRGSWKHGLLGRAAELAGVYAPSLYRVETDESGRLVGWEPAEGAPGSVSPVCPLSLDGLWVAHLDLNEGSPFRHSYLVEVGRGCPGRCRFCAAREVYSPVRWRNLGPLADLLPRGARRLGLVGTAVSDHPQIKEAVEVGAARGLRVGLSSLRLGRASFDLFRALARTGERTVSLAPEAGTDRLRRVLMKSLTEKVIIRGVEEAAAAGLDRIRLYFLLGAPGEGDEDVRAIPELATRITQAAGRAATRGRPPRIHLSISPLVPKPRTPLELMSLWTAAELKSRQRYLAGELRRRKIEFSMGSARQAEAQALLSRGDRRIGDALLLAEEEGLSWRESLKRAGVDKEAHLRRPRARRDLFWGPTRSWSGQQGGGRDPL